MKFELIKKVEGETTAYGIPAKTGDVIDLPPPFAKKAMARPKDYRLVEENVVTEPVVADVQPVSETPTVPEAPAKVVKASKKVKVGNNG